MIRKQRKTSRVEFSSSSLGSDFQKTNTKNFNFFVKSALPLPFYFSGVVTIREDTRGFIRSNFNQQFIIWPCQYDPQAILLFVLDQTSSYVQKQDRIDDTDPMLLAMFTKTLAIIDCISTLISIRPEYFDRFQNVILRIIYLLPG